MATQFDNVESLMRATALAVSVVISGFFAQPSFAAITIGMYETGDDVVFSYSGSLNIDGLGPLSNYLISGGVDPDFFSLAIARSSSAGGTGIDFYLDALTGPVSIGPGVVDRILSDGFDGDAFGFSSPVGFPKGTVSVPDRYVSGREISGSIRFLNHDFSSLGINTDSAPYVWTIQNAAADTITLQLVPEPTSSLALLGLGAIAVSRRKRGR